MEKTLPLEERSIYDIYMDGPESCVYQIPIYQRNYAWEEDEITALIKDVYDSLKKDCHAPYYIGTLVTYTRGDNKFEVIDGQQRLTTIYIILKALGNDSIKNKLTYTARRVSAETIEKMPKFGEDVDKGIKHGYAYAQKALSTIVGEKERTSFEQYFLQYVHIIHYSVPKDVDLNHYFEVMNSRGEQLEKHEIVKSLLGQALKNKSELATFSRIWEACSEMDTYIQNHFPDADDVFGGNMDAFNIDDFSGFPSQDPQQGKCTIKSLLEGGVEKAEEEGSSILADKFQSIIDFPNFLLIVLKLTRLEYDHFDCPGTTLDDKELLNEFAAVLAEVEDEVVFARMFAYNLLKAKFFLDNYIVHHTLSDKEQNGDNPWQLQRFYRETKGKKKKTYPKNLTDNDDIQDELVQLLSMFEVSFTPKQRKNYLFYTLAHLFEDRDIIGYLEFMQALAHKYFYDVYLNRDVLNERNQPGPNAFDSAIMTDDGVYLDIEDPDRDFRKLFSDIYVLGSADIPLFVFNYTDYILWKKYAVELRGTKAVKGSGKRVAFFNELGCSDFELNPFNDFYFSRTRKSLEHYYPQAKAVKDSDLTPETISQSQINCFGNFAMIGAEANSSGSNWDPKTKIDHYLDGKSNQISVASLKFRIMMQMCQDNHRAMLNNEIDRPKGMEWNFEDIERHQNNIINILFS